MKRKFLGVLIAILLVCCTCLTLIGCGEEGGGNAQNSPSHTHSWDEGKIIKKATRSVDGQKEFSCLNCGETKIENYKLSAPTAAQAYSARQAVVAEKINGYDFDFVLSCELQALGISGKTNGTYAGKYRNNETTGEEQFTRTTSGLLFFDSTVYSYTQNSQKIVINMNDDGTVKKSSVLRQQDEEGFFINKAVSSLVDEIEAAHYDNIKVAKSGDYDFTSTLNFGANNSHLGKISSLFSNFGTKISFKCVEFTNPTAIPFSFSINEEGKLEDFCLDLSISIQIKAVKVTVSVAYSQKSASSKITIPKDPSLIVDKTAVSNELNKINSFFSSLKTNEVYSLDLTARNEFDPSWNKLAIVDSYAGRLYKNTVDENVWFNHSYEYKAHHEEDGAEKYKYTIGNIKDGSTYLVSRKGGNTVSAVDGVTVNTQFDYMVSPFLFSSTDVDCIKKSTEGTTTTLNVHLNNNAAKEIQDIILKIVNSNSAQGVVTVNNYMNTNLTIKDAEFIVTYENGILTEIKIKTDIKYNPTGGDYTDYNITLTNELELLVNKNLDDAEKYEAPKAEDGGIFVSALSDSKYYIR